MDYIHPKIKQIPLVKAKKLDKWRQNIDFSLENPIGLNGNENKFYEQSESPSRWQHANKWNIFKSTGLSTETTQYSTSKEDYDNYYKQKNKIKTDKLSINNTFYQSLTNMIVTAIENSLQKNVWKKHHAKVLYFFNTKNYHNDIRKKYPVLHQYTQVKNNHLVFTLPPLTHHFQNSIHMSPYTTIEGWSNIFDLKTPNTIIHYNPNKYKSNHNIKTVRLADEYNPPPDSMKDKGTYDGNFCTLNTGSVIINIEYTMEEGDAPNIGADGACPVGTNGPGIFELPGCQTVYSGGAKENECRIIKSEGKPDVITISENMHHEPVTCVVLKHIKTTKGGMFFFSRMLPSNDSHSFILMEDIDINDTYHDGLNVHGNVAHVYINRVRVTNPHDDCFAVWSSVGKTPDGNTDNLIKQVGVLTEGGQAWPESGCDGDQATIQCFETRTNEQRKAYESISTPYTSNSDTNGLTIWAASHPYKMQSIGYNINFKDCTSTDIHQGSGTVQFYGGAQLTNYNMQGDLAGGDQWHGITYKKAYCGGVLGNDQYGNQNCIDTGASNMDGSNNGALCGDALENVV